MFVGKLFQKILVLFRQNNHFAKNMLNFNSFLKRRTVTSAFRRISHGIAVVFSKKSVFSHKEVEFARVMDYN